GLHRRIGVPALELHGNLWRTRCTGCGRIRDDARTLYDELPPSCDHCGSLTRPDIVLFGESLDAAGLVDEITAVLAGGIVKI
ncbi:MAG: NAD-dependent deacylase, partial [Myxococcales bacterium]|nr:NAD-dependent deacylase [Myxococcales bacterium]